MVQAGLVQWRNGGFQSGEPFVPGEQQRFSLGKLSLTGEACAERAFDLESCPEIGTCLQETTERVPSMLVSVSASATPRKLYGFQDPVKSDSDLGGLALFTSTSPQEIDLLNLCLTGATAQRTRRSVGAALAPGQL